MKSLMLVTFGSGAIPFSCFDVISSGLLWFHSLGDSYILVVVVAVRAVVRRLRLRVAYQTTYIQIVFLNSLQSAATQYITYDALSFFGLLPSEAMLQTWTTLAALG